MYYTDTYQKGMHKLKIAEKYSEVDSASDADPKAKRAKRQLRAKKNLFDDLSESDSDSTTNLLKSQSTSDDQSNTNGNYRYIYININNI